MLYKSATVTERAAMRFVSSRPLDLSRFKFKAAKKAAIQRFMKRNQFEHRDALHKRWVTT